MADYFDRLIQEKPGLRDLVKEEELTLRLTERIWAAAEELGVRRESRRCVVLADPGCDLASAVDHRPVVAVVAAVKRVRSVADLRRLPARPGQRVVVDATAQVYAWVGRVHWRGRVNCWINPSGWAWTNDPDEREDA